ncbi:MAG: DUF3575 domain-containing protein [Muribaculaceae bacterium]|nr:DUF3575 domain-containing protein [Muribaculaceae bacterium]
MKRILMTVFLLPYLFGAFARTDTVGYNSSKHFRLRYVINIAELDSSFVDNSDRITDIREFLTEIRNDSLTHITGVDFRGTASPDGTYDFNVWLSENRLRTFKEMVNSYISIPDSLIFAQSSDIPWDEFRQKVAESDLENKEEVLVIIDEGPKLVPFWGNRRIDHRLLKLKKLRGGKVWDELKKPILFDLRYGDAVFYYTTLIPLPYLHLPMEIKLEEKQPLAILPVSPSYETWLPRLYLKTNLMGLAALSVNLAVEADFAPHWSVTLPVYYSAIDYFKSTIKFRNFSIQPELRYWPNAKGYNHGFFLGAHFGLMYYNFAIGGPYRYQDRRGRTPAIGGGLALGYRKPISKNHRWHIEFTAGAGVYPIDYDVFENTPNYKEGQWVRRNKKTWWGLDQAAITLSYNFPLSKYERKYLSQGNMKGGGL